jgi:hypothetical protein
MLGKISWVERNNEIRFALLGAQAEGIVLGIGGQFNQGAHVDLFGPLADQVDDISDEVLTNAEALQNFLVFVQNVLGYEPHEIVSLGPLVKDIGAWIPAQNERLPEARYAGHEDTRVNDGPGLALPSVAR